ncbi:hypothetical protein MMC17_007996 [Xylographa soralifera]|nr:hypothetical protein [Xylographa soralifera]
MPQKALWYCEWCFSGPHSPLLDYHCTSCGRRRSHSANLEIVYSRDQTKSPKASILSSDIIEPTSALRPSNLDVTKTYDTRESSNTNTPEGIMVHADKHENPGTVILDENIPGFNLDVLEVSKFKTLPDITSSSNSSRVLPDSVIEKGSLMRERNVLQIESEDKEAQLQRYLFHPENRRYEEFIILPAHIRLPGEGSFSLATGEPAIAPLRRPLTPKSRAQAAYTRRQGACSECRAQKRKCLHRLQERAIPSEDVEITQEDVTIASVRNRAAFDYPTRRRRPEVDSIATSVQSVSEDARSISFSGRRTSSIQYGTSRARRLSIPSTTRIRANPVVASPIFEGSGVERGLPSVTVRSNFSQEVLPEYQTAITVSFGARTLDNDQSNHAPPIQPHHNDILRGLVLATGEYTRNLQITPYHELNGASTNADQMFLVNDNDLSHNHHENSPSTAFPSLSQTRTTTAYINTNDCSTLQGATSQAPCTPILTNTSSEQPAQSSYDIECFQVGQFHTTTENQITRDTDYSRTHGVYTVPHSATLPGQAFSMANAMQQRSRGMPEIDLLEPYGPGDLNLYGDFQWLNDCGTEKSSEMDMDLSWEDGQMVASDSGFSFLESGDSTSGSSLTPPSDGSGRDPTTQ